MMGYNCGVDVFIFKVFLNDWLVDEKRDYVLGPPCVDIFSYTETEYLIRLTDETGFARWPHAVHLPKLFHPLKEYKLGPLTLPGPNDPFFYLNGLYPHWEMVAVIEYGSKEGKKKTVKFPYLFGELYTVEPSAQEWVCLEFY